MEAELLSAVAEYRAQLTSLAELLSADPDNAEVREVYEQLQNALSYTLAALDEQQAAAGGEEQAATGDAASGAGGAGSGAAGGSGGAGGAGTPGAPGDGGMSAGGGFRGDGGNGTAGGGAEAEAAEAAASERPRGGAPNNARMHPANRYYRQEPDFAALARQYVELRPYVSTGAAGRAHLDTTSWEATRALTACLLRHDFGVRWWLPEGQLVPPVTNRANYIHWLGDLLDLSRPAPGEPVRGLDIGCGANFIYCLLGAVLYGWHMVGVDVTEVAVRCCNQLIQDNPQLAALLEVRDLSYLHPELQGREAAAPAGGAAAARRGRKRGTPGSGPTGDGDGGGGGGGTNTDMQLDDVQGNAAAAAAAARDGSVDGRPPADTAAAPVGGDAGEGSEEPPDRQGILLPAFLDDSETFAFTMCNPPFFESMQEAAQNPNTAFGGTAAEMVCPGGELAFVLQMLLDSEVLRDRVHWFSTMVGKKSTLKALRKELHSRHVTALRTTELAQGRTSRWAVAWSWQVDPNKATQPLRPLDLPEAAAAAAQAAPEAGGAAAAGPDGSIERAPRPHAAQTRPESAPAPSLAAAGLQLLARRHISFTVQQSGALSSRTILEAVARLLREEGCGPLEVDAATWTVSWPVQVGPFGSGGGRGSGDSGDVGVGNGEERGTKRSREGAVHGTGSCVSNIKARLRVAQQQRGRLEVVATIPNTAPDAAARVFAAVMAALVRGLAASAGR